ncbi:hypothetical protein A5893_04740 [Pedobacter psychrophilus]|uniref:UspA domain-containing protein n=1 Tax=Pedobacter psychrophilus TaxID=1826909 RepID=A0A179DH72_9SPHI|nr:universal stress protein [Pedobacter psychrophilus]OAQ40264.1 hypothetical protein A5893_04740 [Pedobacter psychrophilus]
MKTIILLTDFSLQANNAASYAYQFGQKIKANIHLFNAFGIPEKNAIASQIPWSSDFVNLEDESSNLLKALSLELKSKYNTNNIDDFNPEISYSNCFGAVADLVSEMVVQKAISLVVMSGPKSGKVSRLFFGSDTHDLLDKVICPVLIIPDGLEFKSVKKITYATDLRSIDTAVVKSISMLATIFISELTIAHVSSYTVKEKELNNEVFEDVELYNNINFKNIKGKSIVQSLCDENINQNTDVMVLVHKKYHFPESIFHNSVSKQMANYSQIPLLIYPYTYTEYLSQTKHQTPSNNRQA